MQIESRRDSDHIITLASAICGILALNILVRVGVFSLQVFLRLADIEVKITMVLVVIYLVYSFLNGCV